MFALLFERKFYPLFWLQFLGAFNDNLFKNAMVMLITFRMSQTPEQTGLLITLAAGLFILPFFIFSSLAGQIADRYPKSFLVKRIKLAEVLIMLLGGLAIISGSLELLFTTLFLMGAQSAFFGPIKYALLPEILDKRTLIKGNSLVSGSTFIAILLGTIGGGLGVLLEQGQTLMSMVILGVAVLGYLFSLGLQDSKAANPSLTLNWNIATSTWRMVGQSRQYPLALFAILCISWFWFIGATLLSQIPTMVKYDLLSDDNVVVVLLTLFSVGIAIGSALVGRFMQGRVHLRWHWIVLVVMSVMLWITVWSIHSFHAQNMQIVPRENLLSFAEIITIWPLNLSFLSFAILAIMGGLYIVPLYTLLQTYTPFSVRARMVAVNNIVNALLMVTSAILIMIGFAMSLSLMQMLFALGVINLIMAIWLFKNRNLINRRV